MTHSPPNDPAEAVEIPAATKTRLGLESERSWILVTEANGFLWPGPDLRFIPGRGPDSAAYGMLPPALFNAMKAKFFAYVRARRAALVKRSE